MPQGRGDEDALIADIIALASRYGRYGNRRIRECLVVRIDRRLRSTNVIDVLSDLFILRGVPVHIRSDNGPEFVAKAVRDWIAAVSAKTAFIEPGSPWENGYCESFNSKLRDELLNGETLYSLAEAKIVIETWRRHDNTKRPHSSLGYRPPAPEVIQWPATPSGAAPPVTPAVGVKTLHALRLKLDHSIEVGYRPRIRWKSWWPGVDTTNRNGQTV